MDQKTANKILTETERGYDLISQKFSQTRKHFWRGLEFIKDYTHEGDNILDFGCGNGRLLELIGDVKNIEYFGVDVSSGLIDIAKSKYSQALHICQPALSPKGGSASGGDVGFSSAPQLGKVLDSLPTGQAGRFHGNDIGIHFQKIDPSQISLAFEAGFFNTIYSIAVFHHFPSQKYREEVAKELYRITKEGGHIVVTVWYLWQRKYFKNILKNWKNKITDKSQLDWNDCLISFTDNQGKKFERFHHAFTKRELRRLFEQAGFETEKCEIVGGRNIVLVGKKNIDKPL